MKSAQHLPAPDFRVLFESAPGLYLVLAPDLTIVAASDAYLHATMTTRDAILGRGLFEVFPDNPDDPAATGVRNLGASLNRVLLNRKADAMAVQKYDIRRPASEGGGFEERFWSPVNSPVFGPGGEIVYIIHRVEDVTEFVRLKQAGRERDKLTEELRVRAEKMEAEVFLRAQELAEANRRLREVNETLEDRVRIRTEAWQHLNRLLNSVIEASPQVIVAFDRTRTIQMWNAAAKRIFGWTAEEVIGRPFPFAAKDKHEEYLSLTERALQADSSANVELKWPRRDGSMVDLLVSMASTHDSAGEVSGYVVVAADISERKNLQEQLLRAQRMESIGTLAGGIAHDLNNVLAPILMAVQLLRTKLDDESSQNTLDTLETSIKRGASLIRQILTFARGVQGERVLLQSRHLLEEIEKVLGQTLPKSVQVQTEIAADLWVILGDATQLHQVLMNLCVNARDAMPDSGTLTIRAHNVSLDETYKRMNAEAKPGPYIVIEVADTGPGIPKEIKDKIFEPFFTTKGQGKGTGLGLSTVTAIVKSHNGFINLYSQVGQGSSFKVYLPAAPGESVMAASASTGQLPMGNRELILVVDDEAAIRDITKLTLENHGYRALAAGDGAEGVALFAQYRNDVQLVISDLDMPVMGGAAMIRSLEAINPGVRVISATGLPRSETPAERHHGSLRQMFLSKPFTAEQLLRAVHEMLHSA